MGPLGARWPTWLAPTRSRPSQRASGFRSSSRAKCEHGARDNVGGLWAERTFGTKHRAQPGRPERHGTGRLPEGRQANAPAAHPQRAERTREKSARTIDGSWHMRRPTFTERSAKWFWIHWPLVGAMAIVAALVTSLALMPGPSAGSSSTAALVSGNGRSTPVTKALSSARGLRSWQQTFVPPTTTTTAPPLPAPSPQASYTPTTATPAAAPAPTSEGSGDCSPDEDYALDATTTDTPDWCAIRDAENGGSYGAPCGAYGFTFAYPADPAAQDALALQLFAENHDHFSGTWNNPQTASEGGPLQ